MDHLFQPGNEFGKGRPPGAPNKRTNELRIRLQNRGDIDPAEFCSSIVSNPNEPTELRLAASNYLLPYLYAKRGAVPTPRYIDEPIQLPEPTTIEQANKNIAYISNLKAQGLIDLDFANSLIADNTTIANNLIAEEELKFKLYPPEERDTVIKIEGGLPQLPGAENLIMPQLNGHATNGHDALAPPVPQIESSGTNSSPGMNSTKGQGCAPAHTPSETQGQEPPT
jgi:hypothetical protein